MDDRISAYKTLTLLEKRAEDGQCIDQKCHRDCLDCLNKAILSGELTHKQPDMKGFDGMAWTEFISNKMHYGLKKLKDYTEKMELAPNDASISDSYNYWLAYSKFWQILYDEVCDSLMRDYNFVPKSAADGMEAAFKEFAQFSMDGKDDSKYLHEL